MFSKYSFNEIQKFRTLILNHNASLSSNYVSLL